MVYGYNDPKLYLDMLFDIYERDGIKLNEHHVDLLEELAVTFAKKNADYGNSFEESLDEDGLIAAKVQIGHKWRRFKTLISADDILVEDEGLRDTLMDLANYAVMTVMWLEKQGFEDDDVVLWADGKPFVTFSKDPEEYSERDRSLSSFTFEDEDDISEETEQKSLLEVVEDIKEGFSKWSLNRNKVLEKSIEQLVEKKEMDDIYMMNREMELGRLRQKAMNSFHEEGEEGANKAWERYENARKKIDEDERYNNIPLKMHETKKDLGILDDDITQFQDSHMNSGLNYTQMELNLGEKLVGEVEKTAKNLNDLCNREKRHANFGRDLAENSRFEG